jgi:FkbM family methyltransferase
MTPVQWLNSLRVTHFAIDQLGLRRVLNSALGRFPIVRTLPSGVRYRCRYLDSITLAEEIFSERVYARSVSPDIRTFVDLGCNVGHFVAFLADVTGGRDLRGLAVDADPDMISETEWVLETNHLSAVIPVCGLVGAPGVSDGERDFYIHPCKVKSSAYAVDEPGQPNKGDWHPVRVRTIDLETTWRERVGDDVRCDLLKIDIEGSESDFIAEGNQFLARVRSIVVEIHKWVIAPAEIESRLRALGFAKVATLCDAEGLSVVHFARA